MFEENKEYIVKATKVSKIQIVIDISEDMYKDILHGNFPIDRRYELANCVYRGTPLPEEHGRLIDVNEFNHYLIGQDSSFKQLLSELPTIIKEK